MSPNKKKKNKIRKYIFYNKRNKNNYKYEGDLDLYSIAEWIACGFFLGDNNFTKQKYRSKEYYSCKANWYYEPRDISFNIAVEEFAHIFETLILNNIKSKKIILPLSGGLDSRTIASALRNTKNIVTYSYEFLDGVKETNYARRISKEMGWAFHHYLIPKGYLWEKIEELSEINLCQSDFTHPRQMAVIDQISKLGDIIISGQWGDVLFDLPKLRKKDNLDTQAKFLFQKIVKPGGLRLSNKLWEEWGFTGKFEEILYTRIKDLLLEIKIENPSRRVQAFKSIHWAQRWANPNLNIFSSNCELFAPYYENAMCEFICSTPSDYLQDRKIQIKYLQDTSPRLAKIPWQIYDLNLYNYKYFNNFYFPRRVYRFLVRNFNEKILKKPSIIQRNWELQFLGSENRKYLEYWLFEKKFLNDIIPPGLVNNFYQKFLTENQVIFSHPISMLLTLSLWCEKFWKKK